jgi:hypothetical protein
MAEAEKTRLVLEIWRLRCLRSARLYYEASARYGVRQQRLTQVNFATAILVVVIGLGHSLVGLEGNAANLLLAFASTLVAISSACLYMLDYGANGIEFGKAGARYAIINRDIELMMARPTTDEDIRAIKSAVDEASRTTLALPPSIFGMAGELNVLIRRKEDDLEARTR